MSGFWVIGCVSSGCLSFGLLSFFIARFRVVFFAGLGFLGVWASHFYGWRARRFKFSDFRLWDGLSRSCVFGFWGTAKGVSA